MPRPRWFKQFSPRRTGAEAQLDTILATAMADQRAVTDRNLAFVQKASVQVAQNAVEMCVTLLAFARATDSVAVDEIRNRIDEVLFHCREAEADIAAVEDTLIRSELLGRLDGLRIDAEGELAHLPQPLF